MKCFEVGYVVRNEGLVLVSTVEVRAQDEADALRITHRHLEYSKRYCRVEDVWVLWESKELVSDALPKLAGMTVGIATKPKSGVL